MTTAAKKKPVNLVDLSLGAQSGGATVFTFGPFSVRGYMNGRLRGNAHQNVVGVFLLEWGNTPSVFDLSFEVGRDTTQPDFQYPFDVIILQPFLRATFTNGGGASAFFRANIQALPQ